MNCLFYLNNLMINIVANAASFFWWQILLIVLAGVFFAGLLFILITAIHLRRKKLKRERKNIKLEGHDFWSERFNE